ncbi:hypothetical protein [Mycetocola sp.]|uniref:hypothetical protein n=1 Tax=Mycetocola sp. TaxID=1871042 RepID=UPI00398981D5
MTGPPHSPYGPPRASAQPSYPQQPQVPNGLTTVEPTPSKRGNGPGLAALILGIAAVVAALVPFVGYLAYLFAVPGAIVGVVGLVLVDRPRRIAVWGVALSGASVVLANVMPFVYAVVLLSGLGAGADWALNLPKPEATYITPKIVEPELAADPLPLGTKVTLLDPKENVPAYEATVKQSVLNADDVVTGFEDNEPPQPGTQWALAEIEVSSLGDPYTSPAVQVRLEYLDSSGNVHGMWDSSATPPDADWNSITDLAPGASAVGSVVIAIPAHDPAGGQWVIQFSSAGYGDGERHYFRAE